MKWLVCWFRGHIQEYETIEIEGKFYKAGFCARCKCGLLTFDPPIIIPAHSSVSLPITIVERHSR